MDRKDFDGELKLAPWLRDETQRDLREALLARRRRWLVTGAAGFIGSNLVETLLLLDQDVVGLDNFSTGHRRNLDEVRNNVGEDRWTRFTLHEADIRDMAACERAVAQADYVLHQAALGSVPRSVKDPVTSHEVNVSGFVNVLDAARRASIQGFVYAASSSTYGDEPNLPKREDRIGRPLSPYAVTKLVDEIYAEVYARVYGFAATGLRYFNVFGPRQDPNGAYAAVIPKWIASMIDGEPVRINGDGETSRDFCFVGNVVQANLRAALRQTAGASEVYNVAVGGRTTLNDLFGIIRDGLAPCGFPYALAPEYGPFREGDVRHSQADVSKAIAGIGYTPLVDLRKGMNQALPWYIGFLTARAPA
ncbi:SDR family oxidoreductase [Bordetella bronchialis]|uniref:SDR family oxidoreductase n=1 Tax=Bordetella bronchialis TaxID=463025 RepID=UPI0009F4D536|nr:SDR family oxidoreductase [Bordetella bronchialis]